MIELVKQNIGDIADEYKDIYVAVFGTWTYCGNCPKDVYLTYEDKELIGFLGGYPQGYGTWYLQRGGFIKEKQRKFGNLERYREALAILHGEWPAVMTLVENTDYPALKINLALKYKIIGLRMDTLNKIWVEMIHLREDENA